MPTFIEARLPPAREQQAYDRTRDQELGPGGNASTVSPAAAVEEQLAARPEPGHDVLEIGHRTRGAAEYGRVEEATARGQHAERGDPAADLEALVGDVLVRHSVGRDVECRAQQERERARPHERSGGTAERDVQ
jgi:hypothetical protein